MIARYSDLRFGRFLGTFPLIQGEPENLPAFSNVPLRELKCECWSFEKLL
jgi:hypothetical protein